MSRRRRSESITGQDLVPYDPHEALKIITEIAEGKLLREVTGKVAGRVTRGTFLRWVAMYPDLKEAYLAARQVSAMSLEEEAIWEARKVVRSKSSSTQVQAASLLAKQLQWSASKRDPKSYGDNQKAALVVPVQINTTLDFGDNPGQAGKRPLAEGSDDVYQIAQPVEGEIEEGSFVDVADEVSDAEEDPQAKLLETLEKAQPLKIKPVGKRGRRPKRQLTPRMAMDVDTREELARRKLEKAKEVEDGVREGR